MMYRKQQKIPTILAVSVILAIVTTVFFLDKKTFNNYSNASETGKAENVHFANISDNSFTISWLTSESSMGSIEVSADKYKVSLLDDLDSDNVPRPRKTHYITVKNLDADTTYTVKIVGKPKCDKPESCPIFIQKTGTSIPSPLSIPPIKRSLIY